MFCALGPPSGMYFSYETDSDLGFLTFWIRIRIIFSKQVGYLGPDPVGSAFIWVRRSRLRFFKSAKQKKMDFVMWKFLLGPSSPSTGCTLSPSACSWQSTVQLDRRPAVADDQLRQWKSVQRIVILAKFVSRALYLDWWKRYTWYWALGPNLSRITIRNTALV